jgi:Transposase DDE domain
MNQKLRILGGRFCLLAKGEPSMSEGRSFGPKKSIKNWAVYNEGLRRRYDITVYLEDETVFAPPKPNGERGRPQEYSDGLIELGLTIKAIYRLPYRGLQGFLRGLFRLGDCASKPVPDYTTFCVRAKEIDVKIKTALQSGEPLHLLVDSTGLKIYGEGEWKMRTHGKTKRRTWRKLHLVIDAVTQQIIAADLTENSTGDQEHLPALLNKVPDDKRVGRVTADGIYDTWGCYDAAAEHGADLCTPPRENAVVPPDKSPRAQHPRSDAIRECQELGRTPWKIENKYHVRSLVETAMYRFKTSFGEKMFSRTLPRQKTEAFIKANALNIFRDLAAPAY